MSGSKSACGGPADRSLEDQALKGRRRAPRIGGEFGMMKSSLSALSAACLGLLAYVAMPSEAAAAAKCMKGDRKPPFTIGWADIYSVPTWMKETQGTIEKEVDELKKQGLVSKLVVTDAQGDANTQIQQI